MLPSVSCSILLRKLCYVTRRQRATPLHDGLHSSSPSPAGLERGSGEPCKTGGGDRRDSGEAEAAPERAEEEAAGRGTMTMAATGERKEEVAAGMVGLMELRGHEPWPRSSGKTLPRRNEATWEVACFLNAG
jgi:hypothetical protein